MSMADNTSLISINYSDEKLRVLVEEYITQQCSSFTLKGVCSYVLYWAMEDGKATGNSALYDSCQLQETDCLRVKSIFGKIIKEGRISEVSDGNYKKINN